MPAPTPRSKPKYSSNRDAADQVGFRGDFTITPGVARARIYQPKEKKGPFYFRPWPAADFSAPAVRTVPGRVPAAAAGSFEWGDWNRRVPIVKFAGMPEELGGLKITFHPYSPMQPEKAAVHPYEILVRAANTAARAGRFGTGPVWDAAWNRFVVKTKGANRDDVAMTGVSSAWYMQGAIYNDGEKDYIVERGAPFGAMKDDELPILRLSKQCGDDLLGPSNGLLYKKKRDSDDFLFPDPVGKQVVGKDYKRIDPGLLFMFYMPNLHRVQDTKHLTYKGELKTYQGFETAVYGKYKLKNGQEVPLVLEGEHYESALQKWQFWEDDENTGAPGLLRFASFEEQAVWIATAFKPLALMVEYCWPADFLTDEVMKILRDAKSVSKPGDDAPAGGRQSQAQTQAPATRRAPVVQQSDSFEDFPDQDQSGPTSAADDEFDSVDAAPPAPKKKSVKGAPAPVAETEEDEELDTLFDEEEAGGEEEEEEAELESTLDDEGGEEDAEEGEEDAEADEGGDDEEFDFDDNEEEEDDATFEAPTPPPAKTKPPAPKTAPPTPAPVKKAVRPSPQPARPAAQSSGKTGAGQKPPVKKSTKK